MQTLTDAQRELWNSDGYLHLEGALSPEQVRFFSDEMDRIRGIPGYEPDPNPELPMGH